MIVIIDSGTGNVRSIFSKIKNFDDDVIISNLISDVEKADKIILPGVGSFDTGINNLTKLNLINILKNKVLVQKVPILGICLGMQLFTKKSEEGNQIGLSVINAETKKFSHRSKELNIPHMGWNTINIIKEVPILKEIPNNSRFYFVHSYHLNCLDENDIIASTSYGYDFPSIIQRDNIIGVQFHPEKSHQQGIRLLKNFVRM